MHTDSISILPRATQDHDLVVALTGVMGIRDRGMGREPAQNLIDRYGASPDLQHLGTEDLTVVQGIGPTRAHRLMSAFRLSKWLHESECTCVPVRRIAMEELQAIRGCVAQGQTVLLAYRPGCEEHPITLSSGVGLTRESPIGGFIFHMVPDRLDEWWVVLLRPGGPPTSLERAVAEHLRGAAMTMGVNLRRVTLVTGRQHWILAAGSIDREGVSTA